MKKILGVLSIALMMGSCTIAHTAVVTNNPVGSKKGKVSSATADIDSGVSYAAAVKDGDITNVGIAEYKAIYYVFFVKEYMTVTGE